MAVISCLGVGFSSWNIGNANSSSFSVDVTTGGLEEIDYQGTAYIVSGSESGFGFYSFNGSQIYSSSTMSVQIKIRPDLLKSTFSGQDVSMGIGIRYSSASSSDPCIFSDSYTALTNPEKVECDVTSSANRFLYSSDLSLSITTANNVNTNTLSASALLYSESKPSLYSIAKDFQSSTNFVYIDMNFNFEVNGDLSGFSDLSFHFVSSLEEA